MAEVATAYVSLIPSFRGGQAAITKELTGVGAKAGDQAGRETGRRFGSAMIAPLRGAVAPIAGVIAGIGVGQFIRDIVTQASDLNETVSKAQQIFGPAFRDLDKWARRSATTVGLSRESALAFTASLGDMFRQLGFTRREVVKNSTAVVQLAADLGSFHNLDTADVLERIMAAFRGEYDSLQALIPNINAARVEQVALAQTGKESADALTAQEKAAATLAILFKDAGPAIGDFARTSGSLANQQKILAAQWEDARARLGQGLLPVATAIVTKFNEWLPTIQKIAGEIADWLAPAIDQAGRYLHAFINGLQGGTAGGGGPIVAWTEAGRALRDAWNQILPVLQAVWGFITGTLVPAIASVVSWIVQNRAEIGAWIQALAMVAGPVLGVVAAVKTFIGAINLAKAAFTALRLVMMTNPFGLILTAVVIVAAVIIKNWDSIKAFLSATWNWLKRTATTLWTAVRVMFTQRLQQIRDTFSTVWNTIKATITAVWNAIKTAVTTRINSVRTTIRNAWNTVKTTTTNAWNGIRTAVSNAIGRLLELVRGIPGRVKRGLGNLGRLLLDSGKRIIQGLIDGIKSRIRDVKNAVGDVLQSARDLLPFSPAKEGPFSGRGWTLYSGRSIVEDLAKGINQRSKLVEDALSNALTVPSAPYAFGAGRTNMIGGDTHVTVILDGEPIRAVVRREVSEHDRHLRRRVMSGMGAAR